MYFKALIVIVFILAVAGVFAAFTGLLPAMTAPLSPEELAPAAVAHRLEKSDTAKKEKDLRAAAALLLPLAQSGNAEAQFRLGVVYREDEVVALMGGTGQLGTAEEDHDTGGNWLQKAAEQGHMNAQAMLGIHYCWGVAGSTVTRSPSPDGMAWLLKAAKAGHAEAQRNLGTTYEQGICVNRDDTEAAKWFLASTAQGDEWSMISLAHMAAEGRGTPKDEIQHYTWIALAGLDKDMKQRSRLPPAEREEVEKRVKEWSDNQLRARHE